MTLASRGTHDSGVGASWRVRSSPFSRRAVPRSPRQRRCTTNTEHATYGTSNSHVLGHILPVERSCWDGLALQRRCGGFLPCPEEILPPGTLFMSFHVFPCFSRLLFSTGEARSVAAVAGHCGAVGCSAVTPAGWLGQSPKEEKSGKNPPQKLGKKSGKSSRAWAGGWLRCGEPRPAACRGAASLWW